MRSILSKWLPMQTCSKKKDIPVEKIMILRVGRDNTQGFETRMVTDYSKHYETFASLLNVYKLKNMETGKIY